MRTLREVASADENFGKFFGREYARLARACLLLTGSPTEAEELAQEALVRVYARWNNVGSMESPEGYLYRTRAESESQENPTPRGSDSSSPSVVVASR
jgi:DNA-directed RNA polymerase specialized sigma24 family protein